MTHITLSQCRCSCGSSQFKEIIRMSSYYWHLLHRYSWELFLQRSLNVRRLIGVKLKAGSEGESAAQVTPDGVLTTVMPVVAP